MPDSHDAFENRWLRYGVWISLLLGVPAVVLTLTLDGGNANDVMHTKPVSFYYMGLGGIWCMELAALAYYGHILFRRLQINLLIFLTITILTAHALAFGIIFTDWEGGVTAGLACALVCIYGAVRAQASANILNLTDNGKVFGLWINAVLTMTLVPRTILGSTYGVENNVALAWIHGEPIHKAFNMVLYAVGVPCFIVSCVIFFRVRARRLTRLKEYAAKTDSTFSANENDSASSPSHIHGLLLWESTWSRRLLVLCVVIVAGLTLPYIALLGSGQSIAMANQKISMGHVRALDGEKVPPEQNAAILWKQASSGAPNIKLSEVKWRAVDTYLEGGELDSTLALAKPNLRLAHEAAGMPQCDWEIHHEQFSHMSLEHLSGMRNLMRLLAAQVRQDAVQGDWGAVLNCLKTMVVAGSHLREGNGDISHIVSLKVERMAAEAIVDSLSVPGTELSMADLDDLEAFCRKQFERPSSVAAALAAEKWKLLFTIDGIGVGNIRIEEAEGGMSFDAEIPRLPKILNVYTTIYPQDRDFCATYMNRCIDLANQLQSKAPPLQVIQKLNVLDNEFNHAGFSQGNFLSGLLTPALIGMVIADCITRARWRMVSVAIATKRWQLMNGGSWPATLDDLELGEEDLLDQLGAPGKQLQYSKLKHGAVEIRSAYEYDIIITLHLRNSKALK